jgi:serine/threonine protein kinase
MTSDDTDLLRRADRQFAELLDLPADERAGAIERLSDDPALRSLLVRMLKAHAGSGLLDNAPHALVGPPRQLGQWRIGEELGRGGMAVVYRAERDLGDGIQVAAVKLLTAGALAVHGNERFLREQAILARLDHPHIAGLLDAGVLKDGSPWLAMALVEGERIDTWCENRKLHTRAIVRPSSSAPIRPLRRLMYLVSVRCSTTCLPVVLPD